MEGLSNMRNSTHLQCLLFIGIGAHSLLSCAEENPTSSHRWRLLGEFVYMRRSEIHNHTLVKNSDKPHNPCHPCEGTEVMDNKDLVNEMGFEPGFRVGGIYTESPQMSIEANFLYLQPWHGEKTVKGNQSLKFPFSHNDYTHDYIQASEARGCYEMHFWDLELNYWRHFTPRYVDYFSLSGIAGLRYFHWNEEFKLAMTRPKDTSDYKIDTKNDLFGAQLGLNFQMNPMRWLSWEFTAKVGGMANRAKQKTLLRDYNNTLQLRNFERQKWEVGVFADVAALVGFQFKKHLNLHLGYQVLFFSGLALAPEQINKSGDPDVKKEVHVNGAAIIHGLFAGLLWSF